MSIMTIGYDLSEKLLLLVGFVPVLLLWAWGSYHDDRGGSQLDGWSARNQERHP